MGPMYNGAPYIIYTPNFWAEKSGKIVSYTQIIIVYQIDKSLLQC